MKLFKHTFLLTLLTCCSASFAGAEPVRAALISEVSHATPEQPFWVAIVVSPEEGVHTYWKNSGDSGAATQLEWALPEGVELLEERWPAPTLFQEGENISFGYEQEFTVLAKLAAHKDIENQPLQATLSWIACDHTGCFPGESELSLDLSTSHDAALVQRAFAKLPQNPHCTGACFAKNKVRLTIGWEGDPRTLTNAQFFPEEPETIDYHFAPTIAERDPDNHISLLLEPSDQERLPTHLRGVLLLSDGADTHVLQIDSSVNQEEEASPFDLGMNFSLWGILAMAFLGGALLNLMPCVLPVLSLKVMGFVEMAGKDKSALIRHGLLFTLGVLVSYWILAGILILLQTYGHVVGWGFHLQSPLFVAALMAVLLVFSLSLFGVFELGAHLASWAGQQESANQTDKSAGASAFANGVLATIVATPCTGPFLGTALGFAVTLPPLTSMLIFSMIGLGMASPYLLLSFFPSLLRWVPRPGLWMVAFKQFMGFLVLGTVLWLLWVFGALTSPGGMTQMLVALFFLSMAVWIWGQWGNPTRTKRTRVLGTVAAAAGVLLSIWLINQAVAEPEGHTVRLVADSGTSSWAEYHPDQLKEAVEAGQPVFVDFTARWCVICQTNHLVLETEEVSDRLDQLNVLRMKADWTRQNPEITRELRKYRRAGVPLYLLFIPGKQQPMILDQVLTPSSVLEALEHLENTP